VRVLKAEFLQSAGRPDQFPRTPWPEIAFAGRSNVGKSSMINRLLGRRQLARAGATPGRTRTINFYQVNERVLFVDLPGYGYARVSRSVKDAWWDLVERYLSTRTQLRGVVHIVDARHAPMAPDRELQQFLHAAGVPMLVVLTKADKLARRDRADARAAAVAALGLPSAEDAVLFSAESGEGVAEVWRQIESRLEAPVGPSRDDTGGRGSPPGTLGDARVGPERTR
jgi:GTP-binding protein